MVPVMQARVAALRRSAARWSATGTFPGDELTDGVYAACVQHVCRLNPPTPRRAETEAHLPAQSVGAVAVAVDRYGNPHGDGSAGEGTVHVEMPGGAVDFHCGSGF